MTSTLFSVRVGLGAAALGLGRALLPWLGCGLPRGATDSPPVAPHPGPVVTGYLGKPVQLAKAAEGEVSPGVRSSAGDCLGARGPELTLQGRRGTDVRLAGTRAASRAQRLCAFVRGAGGERQEAWGSRAGGA